ncbi:hypothetical protein H0R92_09600 [Treponema sp. OMZ 840]|uniref:hypothetical protein n=1 Tax=Treponema sp. OMZ 840 TaxID=244313 RepID=UPI003D8ECA5A
MNILESLIKGKTTDGYCEDVLVVTDRFIAVIDGVTSKSDFIYEGKKTGRLAAELVQKAIEQSPADAECSKIIKKCNSIFKDFYKNVDFPYEKQKYGLQAVAAIYSVSKREIWLIGDCQVMVNGKKYTNSRKSDTLFGELRCMLRYLSETNESDCSKAEDAGREAILPWILKTTAFANKEHNPYGYSVINGEEIPQKLIKRIVLHKQPSEVILATDGYPVLLPSLQESEAELARILREDPCCCREYISTKGIENGNVSFDDRTYIRFRV